MNSSCTLSALSLGELASRLRTRGLYLNIPPFVMRIKSPIPVVLEGLSTLYGDYCTLEGDDLFADFHVAVVPKRHGFKSLCVFELDGVRPFTPLPRNEAFAFLEWGMNWCVTSHCHVFLTIHSAVLEKHGRVLIMPAPPGSGKSTLCAALMLNGWRLLSDELALLDPESDEITPSPRPISLKNQSISVIQQLGSSVVMGPVAHDTMKGSVAHLKVSATSLMQSGRTARPAWVVFPQYERGASLSIDVRPKARALVELASNSFNHHVHGREGFLAMARLIDRSACFDLRYGDLAEALAWFDALGLPP